MKRAITILVMIVCIIVLLSSVALAVTEDYSKLTLEELYQIRNAVNNEISVRLSTENSQNQEIAGKTLREIFPCVALAKYIRDKIGLISIDQVPTEAQLDSVKGIYTLELSSDEVLDDLTGIGNLRNLDTLSLWYEDSIKELPAEFYMLKKVKSIAMYGSAIVVLSDEIGSMITLESIELSMCDSFLELPDSIGNLINLNRLEVNGSAIVVLPDAVCNLTKLKRLDCSNTNLVALPENIGNLTSLEYLDISHTLITALPQSIYNLSLDTFYRKGLNIE